MNKLLLLTTFIIISCTLKAQEFNLNNYKYRFQKYRSARFDFRFSGNNDYYLYQYKSQNRSTGALTKIKLDDNRFNINTNLPFNYYKVINTENLQHTESVNMNIQYSTNDAVNNKNYAFYSYLGYNSTNRFYKGLNFTELNFNVNGGINNNSQFSKSPTIYQSNFSDGKNGNYQGSLGKGKGRLEYVTDAVTAMFLLKDLKKKAGIGNYTNEQVENIAKGITKINNTRFIDYRFRLIDQLTLLDSMLKENGINPTSNIRYFTTINDNWLYANRFQRYSGKRWSANYISIGEASDYNNSYKLADTVEYTRTNNKQNRLFNGVELNYSRSKQASLYVQRSFNATLGSGFSFNNYQYMISHINSVVSKSKFDNMQYYFNANWGYLFQPNTRTYISLDLSLNTRLTNDVYGVRANNNGRGFNQDLSTQFQPRLSVFKFFSPRFYYNLSVSPSASVSLDKYTHETTISWNNNHNYYLSVDMGFTYTLF